MFLRPCHQIDGGALAPVTPDSEGFLLQRPHMTVAQLRGMGHLWVVLFTVCLSLCLIPPLTFAVMAVLDVTDKCFFLFALMFVSVMHNPVPSLVCCSGTTLPPFVG